MATLLAVMFAVIFVCVILWVTAGHFEDKFRKREKNSK
jgi:hypothetical protein